MRYFSLGSTVGFLGTSPSFFSSLTVLCASRNWPMNSHPGSFSLSTCFLSLDAFWHIPSAMTRHAPPLTRLVSMRGRSLKPEISICSVPSPSTQTGQLLTMRLISSGVGVYWRCWHCLYRGISSSNLETSPSVGWYFPIPSSVLTTSAMRTLIACPVPPAARMGPANTRST